MKSDTSLSKTEENYIKAIFKLSEKDDQPVNTNAISKSMSIAPASVTDMLKKLAEKELIHYEKYKGVRLSLEGKSVATQLIRKHRLWEVFLVNKLQFGWDQVHDIAEELEHIKSESLVNRLDTFLGNPKFDPHGDPIPNREGKFTLRNQTTLSTLVPGQTGILVGVREHSTPFLGYLNDLKIALGTELKLVERIEFDNSLKIEISQQQQTIITEKVGQNLFVKFK